MNFAYILHTNPIYHYDRITRSVNTSKIKTVIIIIANLFKQVNTIIYIIHYLKLISTNLKSALMAPNLFILQVKGNQV